MTGTPPVADPWFTIEEVEPGVHRITDGSCDLCGDKNRS